jgi:hypothetical protein
LWSTAIRSVSELITEKAKLIPSVFINPVCGWRFCILISYRAQYAVRHKVLDFGFALKQQERVKSIVVVLLMKVPLKEQTSREIACSTSSFDGLTERAGIS